jgi:hypothetical protein
MNQELVDYIKQQMNLNVSKNKITDVLLAQGWQQVELDEAFSAAEGGSLSLKFTDRGGNDQTAEDDFAGDSGSPNRKTVITVVSVLAGIAIMVGLVLVFAGGKKETSAPVVVTETPKSEEKKATTTPAAPEKTPEEIAAEKARAELVTQANELTSLITAPEGWGSRQGAMSARPLAVFFKPTVEKDAEGKEVFNESITITKESVKGKDTSTPEEYVIKSRETITATLKDYKVTAQKPVTLADGSQATLVGGSFSQSGLALRSIQLYAFKGDDVYVVSAVASAANWNAESDMLGAAVLSFKFP